MTDTRPLFRPLRDEMVDMLRRLHGDDWQRPTPAGRWRVRDVTAHLLDTALRRLSFQRDRLVPNPPEAHQDFVAFINGLNATWIRAAARLSPRVLTDLYDRASLELAEFVETLDPDAEAFFPVSWAGQTVSPQWLDVGREFTEIWHHGAQIRDALGLGPFPDARWLHAVLDLAMHACPVAYQDVPGHEGLSVVIHVTGPATGSWTLHYRNGQWRLEPGAAVSPAATATLADEVAWRLFFNALAPLQARSLIEMRGNTALALPLLRARAVIV